MVLGGYGVQDTGYRLVFTQRCHPKSLTLAMDDPLDLDAAIENGDYLFLRKLRERLFRKKLVFAKDTGSPDVTGSEKKEDSGGDRDHTGLESFEILLEKGSSEWDSGLWTEGDVISSKAFSVIKQEKDGRCLYTSVAEWVEIDGETYSVLNLGGIHADQLGKKVTIASKRRKQEKQSVAETLRNASNHFLVANGPALTGAGIVTASDIEDAGKSLEGNLWGGMPQICALSLLLNTPIVVWKWAASNKKTCKLVSSTFALLETVPSSGFDTGKLTSENRDRNIIHLLYGESHYDTLIVGDRGT